MKSVVYACCKGKLQASYDAIISCLCCSEKGRFKSEIHINQFRTSTYQCVFPQMSVKACHFHFAQNIWKRIKSVF